MMRWLQSFVDSIISVFNRTPVHYTAQHGFQGGMLSRVDQMHQEAQMRSYGSVGTLFQIVNRLSNTVSHPEWHLHRKANKNTVTCDECDMKGVVKVESHPALDVWNRPNNFYTGQDFRETFQQHMELVGESVWVVSYLGSSNIVDELWPVRPDRITPIEDKKEFINGWVYTGPDGHRVPLKNEEVIQMKMPNPLDPYRGLGPVQALLVDLDSARYTMEWNRRFFVNNAIPGGVLEIADSLQDHEIESMRNHIYDQHRGVRNAHRVMIAENGAKWKPTTYSMRDMQFKELRELSSDLIMEGFGYPKPMIGRVDDVNRANAEAMKEIFADWLVIPRLQRIKQTLDHKFLPMFGDVGKNGYSFAYSDPTPQNREADDRERTSKAEAYKTLVDAGVEPEDAAQVTGWPPMRVKEVIEVQPPAPPKKSDFAPAARLEIVNVVPELEDRKKGDPDPDEDLKEAWEVELDSLLYKWARVTEDQTQELYDQIRDSVDAGRVKDLSKLVVSTEKATNLLTRALVRMASEGAENMQRQAKEAGREVEPFVPSESDLREIAETRAELLAKSLADAAAREALRVRGRDSTGREVADAVEEHLFSLTDTYLRDQLGGALWAAESAGKLETLAADPPSHFVANETRDKNACDPCKNVNGKRFKSLETVTRAYPNGGYNKCKGGIRCRGTFDPVWES